MSAPDEIIMLDDSSIESEHVRGLTSQEVISIHSSSGSTSSRNGSQSRNSPANNARARASRTHSSDGTNQDGSDDTSYHSSEDDLSSSSSEDDLSSSASALPNRGKGPSIPQDAKKQEKRRWTKTEIIEISSSSNSEGEEYSEQEHNSISPTNSKTFPSGPVADEDDRKMPARSSRMDASRGGKRDELINKNAFRSTSSPHQDGGQGEGTPKHQMKPMHRASRQNPRSGSGMRNSKFQECPICSKLIPKRSIVEHASGCGEDQFPEGNDTNTETPRKARKPPKISLRHVPSVPAHSAPVNPVNAPAASPKNGRNASQLSRNRKKPQEEQGEQRKEKRDSFPIDDSSSKTAITARPKEAGYSGTKRKLFVANSADLGRKSSREVCTVDPAFVASWKKRIEEKLRDVRCQRKSRKSELMKNALHTKNILVRVQRQRQAHAHISSNHYATIDAVDHVELNSVCAAQDDFPLPRDNTTTVFVKKHFQPVEDEPDTTDSESDPNSAAVTGANLSPSRYCLDETNHFDDESLEFKAGEKIGAGYEEEETDEDIDRVLEMIQGLDHGHQPMRAYLAHIIQEPEKRLDDRFRATSGGTPEKKKKRDRSQYEEAMSSFRDLFCRRCCIYDCNLHGLAENYDPCLQGELALQSELNANWKDSVFCLPVAENANTMSSSGNPCARLDSLDAESSREWPMVAPAQTELQSIICKRLCCIFQGDVAEVASAVGVPRQLILNDLQSELRQFSSPNPESPNTKRGSQRSNALPSWYKKLTEPRQRPFYFPCHHDGPCTEENCTCVQNAFFCTKHCIWGATSRNFSTGCKCAAKCTSQSCPCMASNRECDPDSCKSCGCCTDPVHRPPVNQRCRNDNIGQRRHSHLLVAKSRLQGGGWGLFNKCSLKKGDYIHEYLGEVISQDEAERRGKVYDERNQTYLFDLSSDYAVDAWRRGNKTRFMNHSKTPNVAQKLHIVNGDFRIGFFAKVEIAAQSELFFDYGEAFFLGRRANFIEKAETNGQRDGA